MIRNRFVIRAASSGSSSFLYRRARAVVTVTRAFADDIARRGIDRAQAPRRSRTASTSRRSSRARRSAALRARLGLGDELRGALLRRPRHQPRALADPGRGGAAAGGPAHPLPVRRRGRREGGARGARPRARARQRDVPRRRAARGGAGALPRADVCLVPLRAVPLFRSFIPSKMFEILACGRPDPRVARGRGGRDPARPRARPSWCRRRTWTRSRPPLTRLAGDPGAARRARRARPPLRRRALRPARARRALPRGPRGRGSGRSARGAL